jgi:hypothetical protein
MDLELFCQRHASRLPSEAFTFHLPAEVREALNRGLHIFPVSLPAKLKGQADRMIGEATCDAFRLEELAASPAAHPVCEFRIAIGPSRLCVVQMDGHAGRKQFAAVLDGAGECHTLQARRGDVQAWAYFRWPKGLVLRAAARKLEPGVSVLGPGDSCIVPPSCGSSWVNAAWAEIDTLPYALRAVAFESPDNHPGRAMPVPKPCPCPVPCRSTNRFPQPNQGLRPDKAPRRGYPVCGGYRISRRR